MAKKGKAKKKAAKTKKKVQSDDDDEYFQQSSYSRFDDEIAQMTSNNIFGEENEVQEELKQSLLKELNQSISNKPPSPIVQQKSKKMQPVVIQQKVVAADIKLTSKELFIAFNNFKRMPLEKTQSVIKTKVDYNNLVDLDLSGVQQLTNLFFLILGRSGASGVKQLARVNCTGCVHLTDICMKWLSSFAKLEEVIFDGCNQLSERSLVSLFESCEQLEKISMAGTSVSFVPEPKNLYVHLNLTGCPLITPPANYIANKPLGKYYKGTEHRDKVYMYKVIIIGSTPSSHNYIDAIVNGKRSTMSTKPVFIHKGWKPKQGANSYNIFQCTWELVPLFISNRSIVVLIADESESGQNNNANIAIKIASILSQFPNVVFILSGVQVDAIEKMLQQLRNNCNVDENTAMNNLERLSFTDQIQMGRLVHFTTKVLHKSFFSSRLVASGIDSFESGADVQKVFEEAATKLSTICPEFVALDKDFMKVATQKLPGNQVLTVASLDEALGKPFLSRPLTFQKAIEAMQNMGVLMYIPSLTQKVVITDLKWAEKTFNSLFTKPDKLHKQSISFIVPETPVYTKDEMRQLLKDTESEEKLDMLLEALQEFGLIIRIPPETSPSKSLYIMSSHLLADVPVALKHYWTPKTQMYDQEMGYAFSFYYQQSVGLIPILLNELANTCSLAVLWNAGFILQQRGMEALIQLSSQNSAKAPAKLELFVRAMRPPDDMDTVMVETGPKQCMEFMLGLCSLITQYLCNRAGIGYQIEGIYSEDQCPKTKAAHVVKMWETPLDMMEGKKCSNCQATIKRELLLLHELLPMKHVNRIQSGTCTLCARRYRKEPSCNTCALCSVCQDFILTRCIAVSPSFFPSYLLTHSTDEQMQEAVKQAGSYVTVTPLNEDIVTLHYELKVGDSFFISFLKGPFPVIEVAIAQLLLVSYNFEDGKIVQKQLDYPNEESNEEEMITETDNTIEKDTFINGCCLLWKITHKLVDMESSESLEMSKRSESTTIASAESRGRDTGKKSLQAFFELMVDDNLIYSVSLPKLDDGMLVTDASMKFSFSADSEMVVGSLGFQATQNRITGFQEGMKLEALDRKNPSLICVASVKKVFSNGNVEIYFDGWSESFSYVCESTDKDLHPVGYCNHVNHNLSAPKGDTDSNFSWPDYLEETGSVPVPYELFTNPEQLDNSPPDPVYKRFNFSITTCTFDATVNPLVLACSVRKSAAVLAKVFYGLDSDSYLFSLLPLDLDSTILQYPCRRAVHDLSRQMIYFLCAHRDAEHFIDLAGIMYQPSKISFDSLLSDVWVYCCYVLSKRKTTIPVFDKIVKDSSSVSLEQVSAGVQRLLYMYLYTISMYSPFLNMFRQIEAQGENYELVLPANSGEVVELAKRTEGHLIKFAAKNQISRYSCPFHADTYRPEEQLETIDVAQYLPYAPLIVRLNFSQNNIKELPEHIFRDLYALQFVDFSNNNLETIPSGLPNARNLVAINIAGNNIQELPKDFSAAHSLKSLDISDNPFHNIPTEIFALSGLQALIAKSLVLDVLPDDIGNLQQLKTLDLSEHQLSFLPQSMGHMRAMVHFHICGLKWIKHQGSNTIITTESYREYVNHHRALRGTYKKELDSLYFECDLDKNATIDANELPRLNMELFKRIPRIGVTTEDDNNLGGCPIAIFYMSKLVELDLSYLAIQAIPHEVKHLVNLQILNIGHCPALESLSEELATLPLSELNVEDCLMLKTPPREIVIRGFQAVMAYLGRLKTGSVECKRTKLMFVGLGGAGKTSLVRAITTHRYTSGGMNDENVTDGIDISQWDVKTDDGSGRISFSVWDFAGQSVYYNTHQFFLSNRAVYMLLWNTRLGHEHAGLDFWLSSIRCHAPKAPVFVVGTHVDKVSRSDIPAAELQKNYPQIVDFFCVSSFNGKGIAELSKALTDVTLKQKYMGEKIPAVWLTFENKIVEKRKSKELLKWEDAKSIAAAAGIFDNAELNQAVQFLHDLGSVQHFSNELLRNRIVINPQWLVDVMACVVSVKDSPIKGGRFHHKDLGKVWSHYSKDLHQWLLRLTEEFDLTFPLPNESINLVPCLMPESEPEYEWPDVTSGERATRMIYKFVYLPAGLFNRAQVRLCEFSDSSAIWKRGSLLKKNTHLALLKQTSSTELLVQVQGPIPENILFLVHEVFETLIEESFDGVRYDYSVPCKDCLEIIKEPYMFSAQKCRLAAELKSPFLQCEKMFHIMTLAELQGVMPPESHTSLDVHLERAVRALDDMGKDIQNDVFFIYAPANVPIDGRRIVHPEQIVNDLHAAGIKCYAPKSISNLQNQDSVALKDSKFVVIGISNEFIENKDCCNLAAFARTNLRKQISLVVFGSGFEWKKSDFCMQILAGDEVYVDMRDISRYEYKIKELIDSVRLRSKHFNKSETSYPPCFISYCWSNSKQAVDMGAKSVDGAVGYYDPRDLKQFLEGNGIRCWIDVERVGKVGLYEDIADGLKHASVVIACISDEYAQSGMCLKEFRFTNDTLKRPLIIVVVGTGSKWELTEIGLLSLGIPKIDFRYENDIGKHTLLKLVKEKIPAEKHEDNTTGESGHSEHSNLQSAFQELYELAQRKLLRELTTYVDSSGYLSFPRLLIADLSSDIPGRTTASSTADARELSFEQREINANEKSEIKLQRNEKIVLAFNEKTSEAIPEGGKPNKEGKGKEMQDASMYDMDTTNAESKLKSTKSKKSREQMATKLTTNWDEEKVAENKNEIKGKSEKVKKTKSPSEDFSAENEKTKAKGEKGKKKKVTIELPEEDPAENEEKVVKQKKGKMAKKKVKSLEQDEGADFEEDDYRHAMSSVSSRQVTSSAKSVVVTKTAYVSTLASLRHSQLRFKLLCEYEQGWHCIDNGIQFPKLKGSKLDEALDRWAPYLARIFSVLKFSGINLNVLTSEDGKKFVKSMEQRCEGNAEFSDNYLNMRQAAIAADEDYTKGSLKRCVMQNGKVSWLCEEHQKLSRAVLEDDLLMPVASVWQDTQNKDEGVDNKKVPKKRGIFAGRLNQKQTSKRAPKKVRSSDTSERDNTIPPVPRARARAKPAATSLEHESENYKPEISEEPSSMSERPTNDNTAAIELEGSSDQVDGEKAVAINSEVNIQKDVVDNVQLGSGQNQEPEELLQSTIASNAEGNKHGGFSNTQIPLSERRAPGADNTNTRSKSCCIM